MPLFLQSLLVLALVAGGAYLFYSSFGRLKLWRRMEDTPTSKARSAAMGLVELSGVAAAIEGKHEPAPVTGLPCVWWHLKVEEERTRISAKGQTRKEWVTLYNERSIRPFLIKDPSGAQKVEPSLAEVDTPVRYRYTTGGFFRKSLPGGPAVAHWAGTAGLFSQRRRLSERRIEPARPLYALGLLCYPTPGSGLPNEPALRTRDGQALYLATASEGEARRGIFWGVLGRLVGGALLVSAGIAALFHQF